MSDADAVLQVLEGHTWLTTRDVASRLAWPMPRAAAVLAQLRHDGRVEILRAHEVIAGSMRLACWTWSQAEVLHHMAEV